jgi:hypothetical protein
MRSMGTRRVALFAGVATVAAAALAGCSAGQVAETSNKNPSIYGVNVENSDSSVALRGLAVTYNTTKGYPSGGTAPLELSLFNRTTKPVTVRIGSQPVAGADKSEGVQSARSVTLVGGAPSAVPSGIPGGVEPSGSRAAARPTPTDKPTGSAAPSVTGAASATGSAPVEPSTSPTPPTSAGQPAEITIAALSSVFFRPGETPALQVVGLSGPLLPGNSVSLVFAFSNGAAPLSVLAPVGVPLSPAPRGSALNEGVSEEQGH